MTNPTIWFVGDPHGDFRRLLRLAADRKPDAIILLGDLELPAPLDEIFYPILRNGRTIVRGIHGNHDCDEPDLWRRFSDGPLSDIFNLDGRVEAICGSRIAGLGGVFRARAWLPPDPPTFESYADLECSLTQWWWNESQRRQHEASVSQKRLTHRATIFPDVYKRLVEAEADILVTHEAPGGAGGHPYGFQAIRELAELLGAKRAFHGHHHEVRRYDFASSCSWTSVGMRQIVELQGNPVE